MTDKASLRVETLLSLQRALWNMVTPDLRGVAVSWRDSEVRVRFLYNERTEIQDEIVGDVETYLLADLSAESRTHFHVEVSSSPDRPLSPDETWAYLRRED